MMTKEIVPSFWSDGKFSDGCVNLLLSLTPHIFLLFSLRRLEQRRKAKLKTKLIDLPEDVIVNILMRLPTKSLCCIKCASKTFSTIIDSPLVARLQMSRLLNYGMNSLAVVEQPQLMLYYTKSFSEIHLQSLKYNGEGDLKKIEGNPHISKLLLKSVYDVELVFCNLFFFRRTLPFEGPYFLLDPLRGEVLEIPKIERSSRHYKFLDYWYGMGFDNTTNTFKVVCLTMSHFWNNYHVDAQVYVLGQSSCSWREIQSVPPCKLSRHGLFDRKVCAYGDMHWLVEQGSDMDIEGGGSHIISFDFKKEEFCWTSHPNLGPWVDVPKYCHLINLKGCMALVDTSSMKYVEIWVMKNYAKKEWSLDYKTNIQIFEESPYNWFYDCGEWKNGIFFVRNNGNAVHCRPIVCYFLDLQRHLTKRVRKAWSGYEKRIFSYTGSFISLKDYGNLVQSIRTNVWQLTCSDCWFFE